MFQVGDRLRVKMNCEGRIPEVWGEPLEVVELKTYDPMYYTGDHDILYACKFTSDGNTWFAGEGIINYFNETEIEYIVPPKPRWEV